MKEGTKGMTEAAAVAADFDDIITTKSPKRNKFAFACATLASMTSVLLGYGMFFAFSFSNLHIYAYFFLSLEVYKTDSIIQHL